MKLILGLLLLAAIAAGGAGYAHHRRAVAAAAAADATVQTAAVTRGTIDQTVQSTGKVVSNLDVEIKCKASGEVIELPFDVSQPVRSGDVMMKVDQVDAQRAADEAKAGYDQSVAKLAQARQNYAVAQVDLEVAREKAQAGLTSARAKAKDMASKAKRRQDFAATGAAGVSQEDIDTAEADAEQAQADAISAQAAVDSLKSQELSLETKKQDIAVAQADVDRAKAAYDDAVQQLSYTTVKAPMDGVVSVLAVQKGQIVSSGITNVGGGTSVMTLSDLSHMFVLANVDESDIGRVGLGQDVRLTADAYPGTTFPGKVVRIATAGTTTANVTTFETKIEVLGPGRQKLKPQMTANVEIVASEKRDALLIPAAAVGRTGGQTVVTVLAGDNQKQPRPVTLGLTDGEHWEVTDGLREGDRVVVNGGFTSQWQNGGGATTKP